MFRSDARNYAICFSRAGDGEAVALTIGKAPISTGSRSGSRRPVTPRAGSMPPGVRRAAGQGCARRHRAERRDGRDRLAPDDLGLALPRAARRGHRRTSGDLARLSTDIAADETSGPAALASPLPTGRRCRLSGARRRASSRRALSLAAQRHPRRDLRGRGQEQCNGQLVLPAEGAGADRRGSGRQPASNAMFMTARGPRGLLMSYAAETGRGPRISRRVGRASFPTRQRRTAHGASPTEQPEFLGGGRRMIKLNDVVYCRLGTSDLDGRRVVR